MNPASRPPECPRCGQPAELHRRRDARGNWQILWGCIYCAQRVGSDFIPRSRVADNDLWGLPTLTPAPPTEREQCPVCKQPSLLEEHHLAPKELFGDEADLWPQARVCRDCHERWHAVMGLSIGGPPVSAEAITRFVRLLERQGYMVSRGATVLTP